MQIGTIADLLCDRSKLETVVARLDSMEPPSISWNSRANKALLDSPIDKPYEARWNATILFLKRTKPRVALLRSIWDELDDLELVRKFLCLKKEIACAYVVHAKPKHSQPICFK